MSQCFDQKHISQMKEHCSANFLNISIFYGSELFSFCREALVLHEVIKLIPSEEVWEVSDIHKSERVCYNLPTEAPLGQKSVLLTSQTKSQRPSPEPHTWAIYGLISLKSIKFLMFQTCIRVMLKTLTTFSWLQIQWEHGLLSTVVLLDLNAVTDHSMSFQSLERVTGIKKTVRGWFQSSLSERF